jgi:hypothetical protein
LSASKGAELGAANVQPVTASAAAVQPARIAISDARIRIPSLRRRAFQANMVPRAIWQEKRATA